MNEEIVESGKPEHQAIEQEKLKQRDGSRIAPWQYKKGQSGNPGGRPPGISLKEYAKRKLMRMTDEEREEFFEGIDKRVIWEMSEGRADTKTDLTSGGKPIPLYGGLSTHDIQGHNGDQEDIPAQEEN